MCVCVCARAYVVLHVNVWHSSVCINIYIYVYICACVCARAYVVLNVNAWFSSVYIYVCVCGRVNTYQYRTRRWRKLQKYTKIGHYRKGGFL